MKRKCKKLCTQSRGVKATLCVSTAEKMLNRGHKLVLLAFLVASSRGCVVLFVSLASIHAHIYTGARDKGVLV